jgi:hypothetical protein
MHTYMKRMAFNWHTLHNRCNVVASGIRTAIDYIFLPTDVQTPTGLFLTAPYYRFQLLLVQLCPQRLPHKDFLSSALQVCSPALRISLY